MTPDSAHRSRSCNPRWEPAVRRLARSGESNSRPRGVPGTGGRDRVLESPTSDRIGADTFERAEYVYELLDHERNIRRAFHPHDAEAFIRRFQVVVHEHCEHPIGSSVCDHYEGSPVRDAFAGVRLLVDAWAGETPDCSALVCLT
ncbi:MAG TPA: hypothetical protein VFI28_00260 [Candidatus Limnocylindrales bacterium]|nr:hypothetical protein [Candidatus Limnocylindrales bacterium]